MTDTPDQLIDDLRTCEKSASFNWDEPWVAEVCGRAAREIEELRARLTEGDSAIKRVAELEERRTGAEDSGAMYVEQIKRLGAHHRKIHADLAAARAEIERLRSALEKVSSMEAMVRSRSIKLPQDEELLARINYAQAALAPKENDNG